MSGATPRTPIQVMFDVAWNHLMAHACYPGPGKCLACESAEPLRNRAEAELAAHKQAVEALLALSTMATKLVERWNADRVGKTDAPGLNFDDFLDAMRGARAALAAVDEATK